MSTLHLQPVVAAIQASTFWQTQVPPADFAAGTASTAWAPVNAAITTGLGVARNQAERQGVYAQAETMVRQMRDQARRNPALTPTERANADGYCMQLLIAYAPFTRASNVV